MPTRAIFTVLTCVVFVAGCTTLDQNVIEPVDLQRSSAAPLQGEDEDGTAWPDVGPIKVDGRFWANEEGFGFTEDMINPVKISVSKASLGTTVSDALEWRQPWLLVVVDDPDHLLPQGKSGFATVTMEPRYFDGFNSETLIAKLISVETVRTNDNVFEGNLEHMGYPILKTGDRYKGFVVTVKSDDKLLFSKPVRLSGPFFPQLHGGYSVMLDPKNLDLLPLPEDSHGLLQEPSLGIINPISQLRYNPDPDLADRGMITGVFDLFVVQYFPTFMYVGAEVRAIENLQTTTDVINQ